MITLRLGNAHHKEEALLTELLETLKEHPASCDEVWFASEYGFPPLSVHRENAKKMARAAATVKKLSIRTSLQISNTLGHGEYMKCKDCSGLVREGSGAEHMVGPDGTVAAHCFCWNGEQFRQYTCETIRLYAAFGPHTVWFDDDLRPGNHDPVAFGCFCDNCIAKFNARHGSAFTREQLVREINFGDGSWREKYIAFVRESLYDFTALLAKAVLAVSPDSFFGYQYCIGSFYAGCDASYIFQALADVSGKAVKSRPGGGYYRDHNPLEMLEKAMFMAYDNAQAPAVVEEFRPEIENTPDVAFGKSNYGTCLESSLYLACGNNALSYATLMRDYEPMTWHAKMLAMFEQHRPYWQRLIDCSNKGKMGGLFLASSPAAYQRPLNEGEPPFLWTNATKCEGIELLPNGLPLCYHEDSSAASLLLPDAVDSMRDEDIKSLLAKPVLTDAFALEKLTARGYGDLIGAVAEPFLPTAFRQRFTDHPVNAGFAGRFWFQSPFGVNKGARILLCKEEGTQILSEFVTEPGGSVGGIGDAIVTTAFGGKWAIFGYNLKDNVVSFEKRNQILRSADAICGGKLPALLDAPYRVMVIPIVDKAGKTVSVSLLNCSIADTEPLPLTVRNPAVEAFTYMDAKGEQNLAAERKENDFCLLAPPLRAWQIATVFCDKA